MEKDIIEEYLMKMMGENLYADVTEMEIILNFIEAMMTKESSQGKSMILQK